MHRDIFDILLLSIHTSWESFSRESEHVVMLFVNEDVSNMKDFESCKIGLCVCSEKQGTALGGGSGVAEGPAECEPMVSVDVLGWSQHYTQI